MRKARGVGVLWCWLMMAACGGTSTPPPAQPSTMYGQPGAQAPAEATPKSERPAKKKAEGGLDRDDGAPQAAPVPATPAPPPAAAPPPEPLPEAPGAMDPRARYARANAQLSEARRQVDIAAGQRDCANACRALDSMERAAGQICELARSAEERRTCKSAEDQVGSARERVKNACGECAKRP